MQEMANLHLATPSCQVVVSEFSEANHMLKVRDILENLGLVTLSYPGCTREVVDASSLEVLKAGLDGALTTWSSE